MANLRQNIAIALTTVAVLLAGVLLGGITMTIGMLVHEASVLIVIANAMRLLRPTPTSSRPARDVTRTTTPTADQPRHTATTA